MIIIIIISKRPITDLANEGTDKFGLKDVAQRTPVEESEQGLQGCFHQDNVLGVLLESPVR